MSEGINKQEKEQGTVKINISKSVCIAIYTVKGVPGG